MLMWHFDLSFCLLFASYYLDSGLKGFNWIHYFATAWHLIANPKRVHTRRPTNTHTLLLISPFCPISPGIAVSVTPAFVCVCICVCVCVFEQSSAFVRAGTPKHLCLPSEQRAGDWERLKKTNRGLSQTCQTLQRKQTLRFTVFQH